MISVTAAPCIRIAVRAPRERLLIWSRWRTDHLSPLRGSHSLGPASRGNPDWIDEADYAPDDAETALAWLRANGWPS